MPRLQQWAEQGWTAEAGLAFFDSLPAVRPDDMTGEWRGTELPSGHPLDGLLAAYGWYGKRFSDKDRVDPLLFMDAGEVRAMRGPGPLPPAAAGAGHGPTRRPPAVHGAPGSDLGGHDL